MTEKKPELMSRHEMGVLMNSALNDRFALEEAIERVRDVHRTIKQAEGLFCFHCETPYGHLFPYPCPTIKALDGEQ
jgi:hypothetical protein